MKRNFHPEHFKRNLHTRSFNSERPWKLMVDKTILSYWEGGNFSGGGTVKLREGNLPLKATMERKWNTSERCKSSSSSVFFSRSGLEVFQTSLKLVDFSGRERLLHLRNLTFPVKIDGWKMKFPFDFGMVPFLGDMLIFRTINDETLSFGVYFFLFSGATWLFSFRDSAHSWGNLSMWPHNLNIISFLSNLMIPAFWSGDISDSNHDRDKKTVA